MASITSSNAVYQLQIVGLFPIPQQLQGFGTDSAFNTDSIQSAETMIGIDGKLSGGFVFVAIKQGITLQADSDSNGVFEQWWAQQQVLGDPLTANGVISLKGINRKWTLSKGFLTGYPPMPDAGKVLQPRKYEITWESISPAIG